MYVVGDTVRIERTIYDTCGEQQPRPRVPGPEDESGRGLVIVEAPADHWGVIPDPST